MIKKLQFDSDLFGYSVGTIDVSGVTDKEINAWLKNSGEFRLLYVTSDEEISSSLPGLVLVDIKTRLEKEPGEPINAVPEAIEEYDSKNDEQIRQLAFQSGLYSRFSQDPGFKNNEFEKLYAKWIAGSLDGSLADNVVVYKDGNDYRGFVTIKHCSTFLEIGLIAVDEKSRGKGIGTALLNYVDYLATIGGINKIEVSTQFANQPAMNLYQKAGYIISSKKYIYHRWK